MGSHPVAQAGLEFLGLGNPPASAFQSAEITGMSHHTQPNYLDSSKGLFQLQNLSQGKQRPLLGISQLLPLPCFASFSSSGALRTLSNKVLIKMLICISESTSQGIYPVAIFAQDATELF